MSSYESTILNWEPVIGLEIHVQLLTKTKMFSACEWEYGKSPNTLVCPLTMAYPGTLPVVNKKAVENAIMIGKALNCKINNESEFSRKHYFYPDLPKGYQISQYDKPICGKGFLNIECNSKKYKINITRAHLEEDSGKFLHASEDNISLVDYNRSGAPLIEIVTEPDFGNPEVVDSFLKTLKNRIEYIGVSDCDMEKGNLRVDLNVSIMKKGSSELGTRREIKNLNSFRSINKAIKYEVQKQAEILESGNQVQQSTMIWSEIKNEAKVIRQKEDAHDYRYFPEPDLSPLNISDSYIEEIISSMPELPDELASRLEKKYNISGADLLFLISDKNIAFYYENILEHINQPILVLNWIRVNVMMAINRDKINIIDFPITPKRLAKLLDLLNQGKITKENANRIFEVMISDNRSASEIMTESDLEVSTDENELCAIITKIVQKFPNELERLHNGEEKLVKFFMGQIMKETKGKYPADLIIQEFEKYKKSE